MCTVLGVGSSDKKRLISHYCLRTSIIEPPRPFPSDKFLLCSSCFSYLIDLNSDSDPSIVKLFDIDALPFLQMGPFELADLVGPNPAVMTSFDFLQIDTNSFPVIRHVVRTIQDSNEDFRKFNIATPVQYT